MLAPRTRQNEAVMPTVVIAGGSGFIGRELSAQFTEMGWSIVVLTRSPLEPKGNVTFRGWDGKNSGTWMNDLATADAVINLTGESIAVKWTARNLTDIRESRIHASRAIGSALQQVGKPIRWVNGSATGFYGNRGDEILDESSNSGDINDILPSICMDWETAARETCPDNCALTIVRTGVVLGNDGGALPELAGFTKGFLGGHAGSGQQWVPWIHLKDIAGLIIWAATHETPSAINGVSPNPERMADFMAQLRKVLHRPWSPPIPKFALQVASAFGAPDPCLLLDSCRAVPKAALDAGYTFQFTTLTEAFSDLFSKNGN